MNLLEEIAQNIDSIADEMAKLRIKPATEQEIFDNDSDYLVWFEPFHKRIQWEMVKAAKCYCEFLESRDRIGIANPSPIPFMGDLQLIEFFKTQRHLLSRKHRDQFPPIRTKSDQEEQVAQARANALVCRLMSAVADTVERVRAPGMADTGGDNGNAPAGNRAAQKRLAALAMYGQLKIQYPDAAEVEIKQKIMVAMNAGRTTVYDWLKPESRDPRQISDGESLESSLSSRRKRGT